MVTNSNSTALPEKNKSRVLDHFIPVCSRKMCASWNRLPIITRVERLTAMCTAQLSNTLMSAVLCSVSYPWESSSQKQYLDTANDANDRSWPVVLWSVRSQLDTVTLRASVKSASIVTAVSETVIQRLLEELPQIMWAPSQAVQDSAESTARWWGTAVGLGLCMGLTVGSFWSQKCLICDAARGCKMTPIFVIQQMLFI